MVVMVAAYIFIYINIFIFSFFLSFLFSLYIKDKRTVTTITYVP